MRRHLPRHPRVRRHRHLALAVVLAGSATLATLPGAAARASGLVPRTSGYTHIIEVVMENLSYSSATSYSGYQSLAHQYAAASNSYAAAHPSLPNYLDLTGGSTFGITSDCTSCYVTATNIGAQLSARRVTWGDFSEGVPGPCYLGSGTGEYAGKHNPFRYYTDIRSSPSLCRHLLPLTAFMSDLRASKSVPQYSFVTPNLCHDGHDCSPTVAFSWLQGFVKSVTASPAWKKHGLLIVTWDEGSDSDTSVIYPNGQVHGSGGGGHIATLLIAPGVKAGTVVAAPMTHESLLASVESNFHVPLLLGAAAWSSHTLVLP
jgi:phosphatidylinositol-3-phosphatase